MQGELPIIRAEGGTDPLRIARRRARRIDNGQARRIRQDTVLRLEVDLLTLGLILRPTPLLKKVVDIAVVPEIGALVAGFPRGL